MTKRVGDWIRTHNGINFYVIDPREEEIIVDDIAHALSMLCRFGGHCNKFYSVPEHCCHVSDHLDDKYKLWGLLHDATEAYLVDLPKPIKRMIPEYNVIEEKLMNFIACSFGLDGEMPQEVKKNR